MTKLRILGIVATFALLILPISYAVIDDAWVAERRALIRESIGRMQTLALEGEGRVHFSRGEHSFEVRARFHRGEERRAEVISAQKDGEPIKKSRRLRRLTTLRMVPRFVSDFDLAARNYDIIPAETTMIAGRTCRRYDFIGRHATRPLTSIWVDEADKLILRRSMEAWDRTVVAEFDTLKVIPGVTPAPRPARPERRKEMKIFPGASIRFYKVGEQHPGFKPADVKELPNGFIRTRYTLIEVDLQVPIKFQSRAVASSYTDGIQRVAIVQLKTEDFRKIQDLAKALQKTDFGPMLKMIRGATPREERREGWLATAQQGDTTLAASGPLEKEELATLLSRLLD